MDGREGGNLKSILYSFLYLRPVTGVLCLHNYYMYNTLHKLMHIYSVMFTTNTCQLDNSKLAFKETDNYADKHHYTQRT